MKWRVPLGVLAILLLAGTIVTILNVNTTAGNAVEVDLGIVTASDFKERQLDDLVLNAIEKNSLGSELRLRLNKRNTEVVLPPLHVDRCEVSQMEYERYVEWEMLSRTRSGNLPMDAKPPAWLRSRSTGHRTAGRLNSAASGMSYRGAASFCQASDGRLPTAEEAEAIARGMEGRLYPWGDSFHSDSWPYKEPDRNAAQSCGRHPSASTPEGIHDLANNVMEWSSGPLQKSSPETAHLVGAHGAPAVRARERALYALSSAWVELSPDVQSHHLGFRCVYERAPLPRYRWGTPIGETVYLEPGNYPVGFPEDARVLHFVANVANVESLDLNNLLGSSANATRYLRVDQCEASRAQYARFLNDPLVMLGLYGNNNEPENQDYTPLDWEWQRQQPAHPVTGVNWWAADAFARWRGGRLPSSDEWVLIAAGQDGRLYPWGDQYISKAAAIGDNIGGNVFECDADLDDVSSSGVKHLGGNVSEWSRSVTVDRGALAMWVHGGNWMLPGVETARSVFARKVPLSHRSHTIGIRVVYD